MLSDFLSLDSCSYNFVFGGLAGILNLSLPCRIYYSCNIRVKAALHQQLRLQDKRVCCSLSCTNHCISWVLINEEWDISLLYCDISATNNKVNFVILFLWR
jgi:hypothetical protein